MSQLEPDGRTVSDLNQAAIDEVANAKQALHDVLGNTDPLNYQKAMKAALKALEAAHVNLYEVDKICTLAAKRGPYKKQSE